MRQKLVQSGAVDVMIDIRGNFFYTRTVPCQLWFFDRLKERDEARRDNVLMLDARNIYRKVTRAIFDFSPEQQKNIAAIVWLYRGQSERFLGLVEEYLTKAVVELQATAKPLAAFEEALGNLTGLATPFVTEARDPDPITAKWEDLVLMQATLAADIEAFTAEMATQVAQWGKNGNSLARENAALHAGREQLHDVAERCGALTEQIDRAASLSSRSVDIAVKELHARESELWASTNINKARRALENARAAAVVALRVPRYFVQQADWLHHRFPDAELRDIEGLVKLVDQAEIAAHDWSLTPGRYVGIAPEEEDKSFDFREALRSIQLHLEELNEEAAELATLISRNFKVLRL